MKRLKVGINGFGRIGRVLFRAGFDDIEIVGINDLGGSESAAHLLKYDSSHGRYKHNVEHTEKTIVVNGKSIPISSEKDPEKIPWKQWEVDVVLECTGAFKDRVEMEKHFKAGAKFILFSPADLTMVYGVNHETYVPGKHKIVSNASCTTNCLAPVAKVLQEQFGIEYGVMTTIHSYTNDQRILDARHSDMRRARTAAVSMIPTTTGAAKAVGQVFPELKGKIDGISIRVPTPNVSLVDFTVTTKKEVTVDAVNQALIAAAKGPLKGIMECEKEPLVSIDFNGCPASSTVDLLSTMCIGPKMVKVLSWYDNEMGFSHRMVDFVKYLEKKGI
jgi:glyceraldehyde 3-phosphate dehydrogenase